MKKTLSPAQEKLWNDPRLDELKKRFALEPLPSKQASYNHRIEMAVDQLFKELRAKTLILAFAITCGYVPVHQPVGQAPSWKFWETRKPGPRGLTKENFEIPAYKPNDIAKTSWKLNPLNIIQII